MEDRIDASLALGGHAQAAAELDAMVQARPLRERRWAQLIVATYRCGRQADALRAYQRCRTLLADELGLEPGPDLQRLETAVLNQDASLDWHPAAAAVKVLPNAALRHAKAQPAEPQPAAGPAGPSLVGRDAELGHLRGRLRELASGKVGRWSWSASRARARPRSRRRRRTWLVRLISGEHRRQPLTAGNVRARDVPSGIRDVLLRRVSRLPDDTQSLLMVAAVTGRELQPDLLEHVTGVDAEHLLLGLEPAIAAGLVTAGGGWGFGFRHPLIHECLYASVGRVERARLHARVAAALEDISSASTAVDVQLAYHYLSAGPVGDPANAVKYAREAAARAVRQGAWQDAARHLEQALTAISPALPDAGAIRCDVLVELGQARRSGGMIREAHAAFEESISLADRLGDEDRTLAAGVAFGAPQLWGPREWGETDTRLIALLERQLGRIGDSDPARRVRILATLATELYFDEAAFRGWGYANEALEVARRLDQPDELGIAVSAYLWSAEVTDNLPQLRAVIDEMLTRRQEHLTPQVQAIVLARRLTERIRSGELTRFDAEFAQAWWLATDVLHSPELQGQLRLVEACRYLVCGDVERGAGLIESGYQPLLNLGFTWQEPGQFILGSCLMLVSGTLADHAEQMAARLARPDHPSISHLAAPGAALGYALRGDIERARQIAACWFAPPPRSWTWFQAIAYWAQVATAVGVPDPAWLYDQLAPHTSELAIVGHVGDCGGAVDSLLAGLAWRLGRPNEATERAQTGLALETRVGSQIWINRTKDLISRIGTTQSSPSF